MLRSTYRRLPFLAPRFRNVASTYYRPSLSAYQRYYCSAPKEKKAADLNIPAGLRYTKSHEWVKEENGTATFGITDAAQDLMGSIVYVSLPEVGETFQLGEAFGAVDSQKATEDVFAPISGEVTQVNEILADEKKAKLVNSDPYGKGWLVKVKVLNPSELANLMEDKDYRVYCEAGQQEASDETQ